MNKILKVILAGYVKLLHFVDRVMVAFGALTRPIWSNEMVMIVGSIVMVLLGIFLVCGTKKIRASMADSLDDGAEHSGGYYSILSKLMYYPMVFETVMLCVLAGNGRETGIFQGMVSDEMHYTLFNYLEWSETPMYFACFLVLHFLLKNIACIIRFKPFRMVRFWIHTYDAALLGFVAGWLYMVLLEVSMGGFLLRVLFIPLELCIYLIVPMTYILYLAPLQLVAVPLFMPIVALACFIFGISPFFYQPEIKSKTDVALYVGYLQNWAEFVSR